jgi:hypothetical protein
MHRIVQSVKGGIREVEGRYEGGVREVSRANLPLRKAFKHWASQRFREVSPLFDKSSDFAKKQSNSQFSK